MEGSRQSARSRPPLFSGCGGSLPASTFPSSVSARPIFLLPFSCSPRAPTLFPPLHGTPYPAGVSAATHMLRGVWRGWPLALDGASVPLRGSWLQGSLLGEQVGTGESRAGARDRHRHRDRGERARGLRSKRALHCAEELPGKGRGPEALDQDLRGAEGSRCSPKPLGHSSWPEQTSGCGHIYLSVTHRELTSSRPWTSEIL